MSSERNIIKIYFKGTHLTHSKTQYQYNHGMVLHFADLNLPQAFEAHFANKQNGNSKTMIGSENKVEIPDEYFWSGANEIYAWVYLHSDVDDGETVYEVRIPLVKRAKPTDEEPLPEQESTINRAIAELNHAVEQTGADVEQTGADREAVTALRDEVIDLKDSAEESANIATQKAQEASESATSASESEQTAHDYADDAKRYAENAFSSKEIAVANASEAEQAKEDAKQARDDAQDARSDTIQLKQDVVGLKDDVITLKEQTDTNVTHYPKIVDGYWNVWDASQNAFVNTGVDAKGEDGEDGEKGDKGDTGNSGVYIGTDEPQDENINVWVDIDEGTSGLTTDNFIVVKGITTSMSADNSIVYVKLEGEETSGDRKTEMTNLYFDGTMIFLQVWTYYALDEFGVPTFEIDPTGTSGMGVWDLFHPLGNSVWINFEHTIWLNFGGRSVGWVETPVIKNGDVKYHIAQNLNEMEKTQARENIGAASASALASLEARITALEGNNI